MTDQKYIETKQKENLYDKKQNHIGFIICLILLGIFSIVAISYIHYNSLKTEPIKVGSITGPR